MDTWRSDIKIIRSIRDIAPIFKLSDAEIARGEEILQEYPMAIPSYYLSLIDISNPNDPIRKMCVPSVFESDMSGEFDTSGESTNTVDTGIQHKYKESALVLTTNQCAMYCRHCFRKRLVGMSEDEIVNRFDSIADYIRSHEEITNVILSGGDALMNGDERMHQMLETLTSIDHIDLIRIATRMPVVFPMRIYDDDELLNMFEKYNRKKQLYIVTQFNHPNEVTPQAIRAINSMIRRGLVVKNQTVLLKGVNDSAETLGLLLRKLTGCGVVPYYVFQCRPVTGVKSNFQVPFKRGYDIVEEAKAMQSGQGKCFKFCMSHPTGKIEIVGKLSTGEMAFKYHQAKNPEDNGRAFIAEVADDQAWLGDVPARGVPLKVMAPKAACQMELIRGAKG